MGALVLGPRVPPPLPIKPKNAMKLGVDTSFQCASGRLRERAARCYLMGLLFKLASLVWRMGAPICFNAHASSVSFS